MSNDETKIPALCQDCMRLVITTVAMQSRGDDHICQCGGQVCSCGYCMIIYGRLMNGCRDKEVLDFDGPDTTFDWSPEGGIVMRETAT